MAGKERLCENDFGFLERKGFATGFGCKNGSNWEITETPLLFVRSEACLVSQIDIVLTEKLCCHSKKKKYIYANFKIVFVNVNFG